MCELLTIHKSYQSIKIHLLLQGTGVQMLWVMAWGAISPGPLPPKFLPSMKQKSRNLVHFIQNSPLLLCLDPTSAYQMVLGTASSKKANSLKPWSGCQRLGEFISTTSGPSVQNLYIISLSSYFKRDLLCLKTIFIIFERVGMSNVTWLCILEASNPSLQKAGRDKTLELPFSSRVLLLQNKFIEISKII